MFCHLFNKTDMTGFRPKYVLNFDLPASMAVTVMLCQPAVSLSKIFPSVIAPVTASMLKIWSWSVLGSIENLDRGQEKISEDV